MCMRGHVTVCVYETANVCACMLACMSVSVNSERNLPWFESTLQHISSFSHMYVKIQTRRG